MDHLTADEVAKKRFTPVRLREGYDMGEVDAFLDEVEATLRTVDRDVIRREVYNELHEDFQATLESRAEKLAGERVASEAEGVAQAKLEEAQTAFALERETLLGDIARLETQHRHLAAELEAASAEREVLHDELRRATEASPVSASLVERLTAGDGVVEAENDHAATLTFRVETVAQASEAARRLLEFATESSDELVEAARLDAARLISEGEAKLAELETQAEARAEELQTQHAEAQAKLAEELAAAEAQAEERQEELTAEHEAARAKLTEELEAAQAAATQAAEEHAAKHAEATAALEAQLAALRAVEEELRGHLRAYLTEKLDELDLGLTPAAPEGEATSEEEAASESEAPEAAEEVAEEDSQA